VTRVAPSTRPAPHFRCRRWRGRDHFGPVWGLLHAAKVRFDPDLLLTPGYEIFA